ncbi:MAG TPA: class I SAM-dependent methyltransferase, partial [Acidimicrobiia bacterium]|nr:class I SAM-dependent methyltransferase [Acidimicrobiia bacterium]
GAAIETQVADAEALPFEDATFDATLSTFGVMFTPDQERAAAEMARVTRPGGKIGLANWTPGGFVGAMLRTVGGHVPPPAGLHSPAEWGTDTRLAELFAGSASVAATAKHFVFRAPSIDAWLELFASYYGPIVAALASLDDDRRSGLRRDLYSLAAAHNEATDGTARISGEYLEVVATVR